MAKAIFCLENVPPDKQSWPRHLCLAGSYAKQITMAQASLFGRFLCQANNDGPGIYGWQVLMPSK